MLDMTAWNFLACDIDVHRCERRYIKNLKKTLIFQGGTVGVQLTPSWRKEQDRVLWLQVDWK